MAPLPILQNTATGMTATPTATTTAAEAAGAAAAGFTPLTPNTSAPAVVPTGIMGTQPITLPTPVPRTYTAPSVTPPAGTTIDANGNVIINEAPAAETDTQKALRDIGVQMGGKAQATQDLQNQLQLEEKTKAAVSTFNAYNKKKLEYAQQIADMKTAEANTVGTGGGGYSASIQEFERKANADLANLAVEANMAQGNLTGTEKIIKDKLDAQFGPLQEQADFFFKLAANENNDLTESEKIKLTQLGTQKQKEADATQAVADDIHKALVVNGRPELLTSVDKVIADYASGKLTAAQAQSKMYEAAGSAGIESKTAVVQLSDGRDVMVDSKGRIVATIGGPTGGDPAPTLAENQAMVDAFNSAASGLPSAPRIAQARGIFNGLMKNGNTTAAREYIVRTAVEGMPTADQSQIVGRMQAVDSLAEIQGLLAKAKEKGASTNILTGNIVNIAQKLGNTSNQDLSYISSRIQQVLQTYRRSMTGVAFSPSESKEYAKIMPDITNVNDLNVTKIAALKDGFNINNRAALSFAIGPTNYDAIFGKSEIPQLPSERATTTSKPVTEGSFGNVTWKIVP